MADADKPQSTKDEILAGLGEALTNAEVFHNQILIGIYMKPGKTAGGILLTQKTIDEDKWQGKVGVVLKKGPMTFVNDGTVDFHGQDVEVGDWVVYRVSDGMSLDLNGVHCRLIEDTHIKMRVSDPTAIY